MKKVLLSLILAFVCLPVAFGQASVGNVHVIDTSVCGSFTWIDSVTYSQDTVAIYTDTTTGDLYVLALDIKAAVADTAEAVELNGTCNVNWNNKYWYEAGEHIATLKTSEGCDSLVKINITLSGYTDTNLTAEVCNNKSYVASWGDTLTESDTYVHSDSISCLTTTLMLTVKTANVDTASAVVEDVSTGCFYRFHGVEYRDTNVAHYATELNQYGCDSLVAIRIISYTGAQNDSNVVAYCGNSYRWPVTNKQYSTAGTYDTLMVNADSTCFMSHRLILTFVEKDSLLVAGPYCESREYNFRHADNTALNYKPRYDSTGIYSYAEDSNLYVYNPATGCISHLTIDLTIWKPEVRERDYVVDTVACDRYTFYVGSQYDTNKHTYTTDTVVTHRYAKRTTSAISNYKSCYDSIGTLQLTILESSYQDTTVTACDYFVWDFDGQTYTSSITTTKTIEGVPNYVGCDSIGRLKLTINRSPNTHIEGEWMLQPGDTTVLRAVSDMTNLSYSWFKNGSPAGTGATLTVVAPGTDDENSNVDVKLISTTTRNCSDTSWIVITSNNMGIDETESVSVNIYPNPASRLVNLSSEQAIVRVEVYNTIGQQVILRNNESSHVQLDLGNLATGSYTMRIVAADGSEINRKLIVSK